jgi:hypothetical protein
MLSRRDGATEPIERRRQRRTIPEGDILEPKLAACRPVGLAGGRVGGRGGAVSFGGEGGVAEDAFE